MPLDQSKVGQHIASQMEAIEADYGDDCEIGDICTIVEIRGPHGSHVRMRSTASSPHSTLGLLKLAEQVALANFGRDGERVTQGASAGAGDAAAGERAAAALGVT